MTNQRPETPWQEQAQNPPGMAVGGFGEGAGTGFNIGGPAAREMGLPATIGQYGDGQLEHIINSVLDNDPATADADITVSVQNGVVTLGGTVRHRVTMLRAENDAWSVPSVQEVENNIQVKPRKHEHPATEPSGQDGSHAQGQQAPGGIQHGQTKLDDEEIRNRIYDALDRDHSIPDAAHIEVHVNNGVVTLQGTVPSKGVKHAAGEISWQMNAVSDVYNQLQINRRGSGSAQTQRGLEVERRASTTSG